MKNRVSAWYSGPVEKFRMHSILRTKMIGKHPRRKVLLKLDL